MSCHAAVRGFCQSISTKPRTAAVPGQPPTDLLARSLATVIVAPLEPAASDTFADRLNPILAVEGSDYVLIAQEVVTIRSSALGQPVASLADSRDAIIAALALLFTGF